MPQCKQCADGTACVCEELHRLLLIQIPRIEYGIHSERGQWTVAQLASHAHCLQWTGFLNSGIWN